MIHLRLVKRCNESMAQHQPNIKELRSKDSYSERMRMSCTAIDQRSRVAITASRVVDFVSKKVN